MPVHCDFVTFSGENIGNNLIFMGRLEYSTTTCFFLYQTAGVIN